jgi:hypothetical protein
MVFGEPKKTGLTLDAAQPHCGRSECDALEARLSCNVHHSAEAAAVGITLTGPSLTRPLPPGRRKCAMHQQPNRAQGPPAPEAGAGGAAEAAAVDTALAAALASKASSMSAYGFATRLFSLTRSFFSSCNMMDAESGLKVRSEKRGVASS